MTTNLNNLICIKRLVFLLLPLLTLAHDYDMHPDGSTNKHSINKRSIRTNHKNYNEEFYADYWLRNGQEAVQKRVARKVNENIAKNVILFLGDGMSIPTLSASRIYMGGEEQQLAFDKFPWTGLSKTYCVDNQVADSACSATAYLGGVKANLGTIGVTAAVPRHNCTATHNPSTLVWSIAHHAQSMGKATGLVTTARVTHASPAGVYAHTANRDWESDTDILNSKYENAKSCPDIAQQLIYSPTGRNLKVVFGGGRANFLPKTETDPLGDFGNRSDGVNLIEEFLMINPDSRFIWNRDQLLNLDVENTEKVLGMFNADHISFNLQRNASLEPSLQEMTLGAIKMLSKEQNGYFLFVEGARIDMAHHQAQARMAVEETAEFSRAIQAAVEATSEKDTLIVVTSDHAHTMSHSGYAARGDDVLGIAGIGTDSVPYAILNYANGPGYKKSRENGIRYDITEDDMSKADYRYPGLAPMPMETHGGDDVGIFARGPWSHLFTGVMEQNVIPHLMSFAMCLPQGTLNATTACDLIKEK